MIASLNIQPKRAIWITFAIIAGIYAAINLGLSKAIGGFAGTYIVQPVLWLILGGAVLLLPRYRTAAKLKDKASIIQLRQEPLLLHPDEHSNQPVFCGLHALWHGNQPGVAGQ
jgi:hypothetical protein